MRKRKLTAMTAAVFCAVALASGCAGGSGTAKTAPSASEKAGEETESVQGEHAEDGTDDAVEGYELTDRTDSGILQSEVRTYTHPQSGATVVCIDNEDPELAFGIFYHTPVIDETDTNHVFEHAIVASSAKYPSSDLFFDMANKSYCTFINAFTYDTFTGYPLSSMSEEQLLCLMDAYLSCMVEPEILEEENIFRREAIRYELRDPEDPIELTGTVYSEDFGFLTDMDSESLNNVADALYPGETASNSIGRAHRNYQDLTYEHAIETFDRCYSFDNSLILLYGDMDYEHVMGFIHEEYLSQAKDRGTDLSEYTSETTEPGYVETVVECPAFEGDVSENASIIDYAVSMDGADWDTVLSWEIVSGAMNQENSIFMQELREAGIGNQAEMGMNLFTEKPYLLFRLYQAEEEQAKPFQEAVERALSRMAEEGLEEELLASVLKQEEIANYQIRDLANAGVNLFPNIVNGWTHTGETDYYGQYEAVLSALLADSEQAIVKELAASVLDPQRSALVTTVPTPGLAEELIAQRDQYLTEMKASMSEEEIAELIAQTEEFDAWNAEGRTNSDFVIDPAGVEDPEFYDSFAQSKEDGMTFYAAPAQVEQIGRFAVYLDSSALTNEDIRYLSLYWLLLGELPAGEADQDEIRLQMAEYLSGLDMTPMYPEASEAGQPHPMLRFMWTGLAEDQGESLTLLLTLLRETRLDDADAVLELINRHKESCDLSRYADFMTLAGNQVRNGLSADIGYKNLFNSQEFYDFLQEISKTLAADETYIDELSARLEAVRGKLLTRQNLIYLCAASEETLPALQEEAKEILAELPAGQPSEMAAELKPGVRRLGIIVESPAQYVTSCGNFYETEEMKGRYLPFLTALSDRYLIPTIRFQNGAYSAGISCNLFTGSAIMYSYSDPDAGNTIRTFEGIGDAAAQMELTQEELNGYILNTLASGNTRSNGVLSGPVQAVEAELMGYDTGRAQETLHDIKNASLEDQEKAGQLLADIFAQGNICAVGNEEKLRAQESQFDELISYRRGN